jgi:hypothetical protein
MRTARTWKQSDFRDFGVLFRHACGLRGRNWSAPEIEKELADICRRYYSGQDPSEVQSFRISEIAKAVMQYEPNAKGTDQFWFDNALIDEMSSWFKVQDRRQLLGTINSDLREYRTRSGKLRRTSPIGYHHVSLVALAICKAMWQQIDMYEEFYDDYEIPYDFLKPCTGMTDGTRIMAAVRFLDGIDFFKVQRIAEPGQCNIYAPGESSEAAPDSLTNVFSEHPLLFRTQR